MDKLKSSFNTEKGVLKILRRGAGWNFVCVLVYLVFPKSLFSIADLFAVRYLWVVCNEDKCCVVTHRAVDICVAWLVYLAFLRSHVLRAYCNFESKQANSITLFERRPNKKESLNTARKWERRARIISEVGFLRESLGWAIIKCLLSAITSVHGRFPFTRNFRKLPWKGPSSEECVPFDTSSIRLCFRHQNSRWWLRYRRE